MENVIGMLAFYWLAFSKIIARVVMENLIEPLEYPFLSYTRVNRAIEDFSGNGLVIGCGVRGVNGAFCGGVRHHENDFYTIDVCPDQNPDLIWDITKSIPRNLLSRKFSLIDFESVPYDIFIDENSKSLHNASEMLDDNGIVIITTSLFFIKDMPKETTYRILDEIKRLGFKYAIRIGEDEIKSTILLSKNSDLINFSHYNSYLSRRVYVTSGILETVQLESIDLFIQNFASLLPPPILAKNSLYSESERDILRLWDRYSNIGLKDSSDVRRKELASIDFVSQENDTCYKVPASPRS